MNFFLNEIFYLNKYQKYAESFVGKSTSHEFYWFSLKKYLKFLES